MELYKDEKINEIFKLAQDFKNNKLWDKLSDSEFFAVEFRDGRVGYVRIIGDAKNNLWQLIIYPGKQAFSNMKYLYRDNEQNELMNFEFNNMQDMIQLSFDPEELTYEPVVKAYQEYLKDRDTEIDENTLYPNLLRYYPHTFPDLIRDEMELDYIRTALLAQNEIAETLELENKNSKELGFFSRPIEMKGKIPLLTMGQNGKFDWSTIETPGVLPDEEPLEVKLGPEYDELLKKLKVKITDSRWHAFLTYLPVFIKTDESMSLKAPIFLVFCNSLLGYRHFHSPDLVSVKDLMPLPVLSEYNHENLEAILVNMAEQMLKENFKPKEIQVTDERTLKLIEDFCNRTGIKIFDGSKNQNLAGKYNKDIGDGLDFLFKLSPEEIKIGETLPLMSADEYHKMVFGPDGLEGVMKKLANSVYNTSSEDVDDSEFGRDLFEVLDQITLVGQLEAPGNKDIYKDSLGENNLDSWRRKDSFLKSLFDGIRKHD